MNQWRDFPNISTLSMPKPTAQTYTSSLHHLTTTPISPYLIHDHHTSADHNLCHLADDQQKNFNERRIKFTQNSIRTILTACSLGHSFMTSSTLVKVRKTLGPYTFLQTIGGGATSVVKLCQNSENEGYYACKIIPKDVIVTDSDRARFESEVRVNQQLHHPGIVEMLDILKDSSNYYLILELCPNSHLLDLITSKGRLSEKVAKPLVRQILEIMKYCHSLRICHRDIKPENLMFTESWKLKLTDFGLAVVVGDSGLVEGVCGSPCYSSPECLSGEPYDGRASDMWSVGVVVYALLTGYIPWTSEDRDEVFAQIRQGQYDIPDGLSRSAASFIRSLMMVDAEKRMTAEQALEHAWLSGTPEQYDVRDTVYSAVSLPMVDKFFHKEVRVGHFTRLKKKDTKTTAFDEARLLKALGEASPDKKIQCVEC